MTDKELMLIADNEREWRIHILKITAKMDKNIDNQGERISEVEARVNKAIGGLLVFSFFFPLVVAVVAEYIHRM